MNDQYIEEIDDNVTFKCSCGFKFRCGIVDLNKHSIYCPECKKESLVDPETELYEHEHDWDVRSEGGRG